MALTILFKFCGFIVHSKPNNMTLSAFRGKIPETRKIVLIFCPSPDVAPKPSGQSRSHSTSCVPLQIGLSPAVFLSTLKTKGSSRKKKIKFSVFSKMSLTILI